MVPAVQGWQQIIIELFRVRYLGTDRFFANDEVVHEIAPFAVPNTNEVSKKKPGGVSENTPLWGCTRGWS